MWGLLPVSTFKPPWLKIWHKNFVYKVYITHLNIELTMIKLNNAIYDQPKTNPGSVWFSIGRKLSKVDNRLAEETKSAFQLSKNLPTLHETSLFATGSQKWENWSKQNILWISDYHVHQIYHHFKRPGNKLIYPNSQRRHLYGSIPFKPFSACCFCTINYIP